MLDEELKAYILECLEKGHSMDSIKKTLMEVGHEIDKIETASHAAFEHKHKDLISYIEFELRKGNSLEKIRQDLVSLGHHPTHVESVLTHIMDKYKTPEPKVTVAASQPQQPIAETPSSFKTFFTSKLFVVILIMIILVSSLITSYVLFFPKFTLTPEQYQKVYDACGSLSNAQADMSLPSGACFALLNDDVSSCSQLSDQNLDLCKSLYSLTSAVIKKDVSYCEDLSDKAQNKLCVAITEREFGDSCNDIDNLQFNSLCWALDSKDITNCDNSALDDASKGNCKLAYYMTDAYYSKDVEKCNLLPDENSKLFCKLLFVI